MADEPSRPTVDLRPAPLASVDRPWRPTSILYPAFFGGPLAALVLGLVNGRRLALAHSILVTTAVAGVTGILVRFGLTGALHEHGMGPLLGSVTGVAVWVAVMAGQRRPFRAHESAGGDTASLIRPGIVAALGCGVLEAVVLATVVTA